MLSTSSESLFKEMQRIADKIKSQVESQLSEDFRTFDVIEDLQPSSIKPDERTSYKMMIKTDDNGHVKVKTMRKDPGSDWKVEVEEYDRGSKSIKGGEKGKSSIESDYFNDMQKMASRIKSDVEKQLNEAFKTFDVFENRLAIKTDNNGQLRLKTSQKDAGSDLKVEVEKFDKGSKQLEGQQKEKKTFTARMVQGHAEDN